jgi:UDP-glucose 4-epimerase
VNGINKIAGESYHKLYNDVYGIKTCVLRLTNVFGAGMRISDARQTFVGVWIRNLVEGKPFEVWGGRQIRDFTCVGDVVEAFLAAAVTPATRGMALNVGGYPPISLLEFADMLIAANGGRGSYVMKEFPAERAAIDIGGYYTDDRVFRDLTHWRPSGTLLDSLKQTIEFYQENYAHYVMT